MYLYKGVLAYDGSLFWGWQKTKGGPSIEETLERALAPFTKSPSLEGASRTDRGVHARGQVFSFELPSEIAPPTLHKALNARLPSQIRLLQLDIPSPSFHPSLDATGKEYRYYLCAGKVQNPFYRLYSWHYLKRFDPSRIEEAFPYLLQTHDFSTFTTRRKGAPQLRRECTLHHLSLHSLGKGRFSFHIRGDRFLYKMARTLVGTLTALASHNIDPSEIPSILSAKRRSLAGMSAPAHGLFLEKVLYQDSLSPSSTPLFLY